jgi:hypothetical protein
LPTVTGLTISVNPPGIGSTVSAGATATLSSGATAPISQGFTTDTPSVATITSAGAITGLSIGDVTVSVDYQGFRASKKVRVLPSYNGIYSGTYTLDACTPTGAFADQNFCSQFATGSTLQIALNNVQSLDLTTMTSQFLLGQLLGNATATIASNGGLTYSGSAVTGTTTIAVQNFSGSAPAVGQIAGTFQVLWTDSTITGNMVWKCTITSMTRVSGGVAESLLGARHSAPATLFDAMRAIARR